MILRKPNNTDDEGESEAHEETEEELRRREWEEIQRKFRPQVPLYDTRFGGRGVTKPARKKPADPLGPKQGPKRSSYQQDPRYRSFYEEIRRSQHKQDYDENPNPMTLDELEAEGWDGGPLKPQSPPPPTPVPPSLPDREAWRRSVMEETVAELLPGTVMRFDDGSVAIYKDAVSGKDYALFYFLEPDGRMAARGIFLEQYEKERIGMIPGNLFSEMIQSGTWEREAIVYYLDSFENATYIPKIQRSGSQAPTVAPERRREYRETRRPRPEPPPAQRPTRPPEPEPETELEVEREAEPETVVPPSRAVPKPPARDPLERGRVVRINVAGRIWECVYWTRDEIGPIVAHVTNVDWTLMHLDLKRFGDSIQYGELLDGARLAEIEASLSRQHSS
jgi:hypothetical protein